MQQENGFKVVKGFTVKAKKTKIEKRLTEQEMKAVLDSITWDTHKGYWKRNKAITQFLLHTGLRVGEFSKLKLSDVLNVSAAIKDVLDIRAEIAKRNKARHVPLNKAAKESVATLLEGRGNASFDDALVTRPDRKPLSKRAIQDVVTLVCLKAGITRLMSAHSMRHTFLSRVYEKTGNIKTTQELAGHSSSRLTMDLYTHTTMQNLEDAVKCLDDDNDSTKIS